MVLISQAVVPNICLVQLICQLKNINAFSGVVCVDDGINVCNWVQTGVRTGMKVVSYSEARFLLEMQNSSSCSLRQWVDSPWLPGSKGLCTLTQGSCERRRSCKMSQAQHGNVLTAWMTQFFIRNQPEVKERYRIGTLW